MGTEEILNLRYPRKKEFTVVSMCYRMPQTVNASRHFLSERAVGGLNNKKELRNYKNTKHLGLAWISDCQPDGDFPH